MGYCLYSGRVVYFFCFALVKPPKGSQLSQQLHYQAQYERIDFRLWESCYNCTEHLCLICLTSLRTIGGLIEHVAKFSLFLLAAATVPFLEKATGAYLNLKPLQFWCNVRGSVYPYARAPFSSKAVNFRLLSKVSKFVIYASVKLLHLYFYPHSLQS